MEILLLQVIFYSVIAGAYVAVLLEMDDDDDDQDGGRMIPCYVTNR